MHTGVDAVKAVMAGAHAVQIGGRAPQARSHAPHPRPREMAHWLDEREYESLEQAQGSMSLLRCPDPEAFERGNYMRILQTWRR